MTTKTPAPQAALALATSHETGMTLPQQPQNIMAVLGQANKDDVLLILKQAKREELTAKKTGITARLDQAQAAGNEISGKLTLIGPSRKGEIDTKAAERAAKALVEAGFGKFGVEVTFDNCNDEKKVYEYTIKVVETTEGTSSYNRDKFTLDATLPFDAETKDLLKQGLKAQQRVSDIQQELLEVKKDFANIPELIEAARADIARRVVATYQGGQEFLDEIGRRKQVITVDHAAD